MGYTLLLDDVGVDVNSLEDRPSIDRPEPMTPRQIAGQYYLDLNSRGVSIRQIANMVGLPKSTVSDRIQAAAERRLDGPPPLVPIISQVGMTPKSKCPHTRKIRRGSRFYCLVCHATGFDHKALPGEAINSRPNKDYVDDPHPAVYSPPKLKSAVETRKHRRAKQFALLT